MDEVKDLAIIGAGPVGLFGLFYAGMRHMSTVLIESLPELGGQLAALYPEKLIYDVAGFPEVKAKALVQGLAEQARRTNPECEIRTGEKVFALQQREDGTWAVGTNKGVYLAKAVIITAGIGAFEPNRLPNKEAGEMRAGAWLTAYKTQRCMRASGYWWSAGATLRSTMRSCLSRWRPR